MVCIYCAGQTRVTNSRLQKRQNQVWRRRNCQECDAMFTTLEAADLFSAVVATKDRQQQPFSRDTLFISIYEACRHRKSAVNDAAGLTNTVLQHLYPLIQDAALQISDIVRVTTQVLTRYDKAAAVQYAAYHPL